MQQVVNHRLKLSTDGAVLVPLILFCNPSLQKRELNHNQGTGPRGKYPGASSKCRGVKSVAFIFKRQYLFITNQQKIFRSQNNFMRYTLAD